ncbi:MAG: cytochrome c oxidase assembly protein [Thermoleophilia bacterium]|nr:cytochrome c oxidase assembly protein [Thermoleophilia bacterium]
MTPDDWYTAWSGAPLVVAPAVVAGILYAMRARTLGPRQPAWRSAAFAAGLGLVVLAAVSPLDPLAQELFSAHMLWHVLITEAAAPLIVLGLSGAMLRPLLRHHWLRPLEVLAHPVVALPLWTATLIVWHIPAVLALSLRNEVVHAVQHGTFLAAGILLWWPVKEVLPAPRWFGSGAKALYLLAFWFVCLVVANVFWFAGQPFYAPYEATAPVWGLSALEDQAMAGTVMMIAALVLVGPLLIYYFFRMARDSDQRQRLVELGVPEERARRAVRYGRGEWLIRRAERERAAAPVPQPVGAAP